MVDIVTRVNNVVNGFVWGPFGLALLLCTGLWLSVRTGFFQFRRMGYWLKHTIGAIFTNKDVTAHTSKEDMAISHITFKKLICRFVYCFGYSPLDNVTYTNIGLINTFTTEKRICSVINSINKCRVRNCKLIVFGKYGCNTIFFQMLHCYL